MKKKIYLLLLLLISVFNAGHCAFITNAGDCGYMGDQLINYIKAKYLAHKYNIPFRFRPKYYLEHFVLDSAEIKVQQQRTEVEVNQEDQLKTVNPSCTYNVSYACQVNGWKDRLDINTWDTALQDKAFMKKLRELIALKHDINVVLPSDVISVAVHVRKPLANADYFAIRSCQRYNLAELSKLVSVRGEGADKLCKSGFNMDDPFPDKFLPDQYYIDQIKRVQKLFPDQRIRVYLFTNSAKRQELCTSYAEAIGSDKVEITATMEWELGSPKAEATLAKECMPRCAADLIVMSRFDYLIRSDSNFSRVSDFIGNHKLVISPKNLAWYKNDRGQDCLVVETVIVKTGGNDGTYVKEIVDNMQG